MRRLGFIVAGLLAIGLVFTSSTSSVSANAASSDAVERFEHSVEALYGHWFDIQLATLEHLESGESQAASVPARGGMAEKHEALSLQVQSEAAALVDHLDNDELVHYLRGAAPLPFMAMIQQVMLQHSPWDEESALRLRSEDAAALVRAQPALQRKVIEIWWDDRPLAELLSSAKQAARWNRLRGESRHIYMNSPGAYLAPFIKQLVSPERLQDHLAQATQDERVDQLPEHIRTLIEASVMPTFADLPDQWLLEQVEAGKLIWLNSLANAAPELAEPFLIEHSASMDLTQRLMLVTTQPRHDDLYVAQDAWRLLMDAAWCEGCGPTLDPDLPAALVAALMSMSGEEPARMLRDLLDEQVLPDFDIYKHNIGIQALTSNEAAMQRLGLDLAEKHGDIPLIPYNFPALHANAPEQLGKLAEQRLEVWRSRNETEQVFAGQDCEAVGLAFYIDPAGRRYDWRSMLSSVSESELTLAGSGCSIWLGNMLSINNQDVNRLESITGAYLEQDLDVDAWTNLMRTLRRDSTELQRLNLTSALLDTPIWGELDESWREWLLGEKTPSGETSSGEFEPSEET